MGAKPEDYERSAPYRSYIHVDEFESPKELAAYLHQLDKNDELYNSYFRYVNILACQNFNTLEVFLRVFRCQSNSSTFA